MRTSHFQDHHSIKAKNMSMQRMKRKSCNSELNRSVLDINQPFKPQHQETQTNQNTKKCFAFYNNGLPKKQSVQRMNEKWASKHGGKSSCFPSAWGAHSHSISLTALHLILIVSACEVEEPLKECQGDIFVIRIWVHFVSKRRILITIGFNHWSVWRLNCCFNRSSSIMHVAIVLLGKYMYLRVFAAFVCHWPCYLMWIVYF